MLNSVAKRWVKALRSRKYRQGKKFLANDGKYCCLGVLCDLAVKSKIISEPQKNYTYLVFESEEAVLPESVRKWVGLRDNEGHFHGGENCLTALNDNGKRFSTIAKIIEAQPRGLFAE